MSYTSVLYIHVIVPVLYVIVSVLYIHVIMSVLYVIVSVLYIDVIMSVLYRLVTLHQEKYYNKHKYCKLRRL